MKLKVNKKEFIESLALGGVLAGKNKAMQVLDNVKCVIRNGNVFLTSYDADNIIVHKGNIIECEVEETCFLVSPKDLSNILKSIHEDTVTLDINDGKLTVKHSKGRLSLPILSGDDFPVAPKDEITFSAMLPVNVLGDWISKSRFFVGEDALRPAFNSMRLAFDANEVSCAATNAQKLFFDKYTINLGDIEHCEALVPSKMFNNILAVLSTSENENVKVEICGTCISFGTDTTKIRCRLNEAKFPNVLAVIPKDSNQEVVVSKVELVDSLHRVAITSNAQSNLIVLDVNGVIMSVDSEDIDFSRGAHDECVCEIIKGNGIRIGVKGTALLDCLSAIDGEKVTFRFVDPSRAITLYDQQAPNKCLLLMPMLIE